MEPQPERALIQSYRHNQRNQVMILVEMEPQPERALIPFHIFIIWIFIFQP